MLSVKGARVGDFSGKSLSTLNTSILEIDPDIPQAGILRSWYALSLLSIAHMNPKS